MEHLIRRFSDSSRSGRVLVAEQSALIRIAGSGPLSNSWRMWSRSCFDVASLICSTVQSAEASLVASTDVPYSLPSVSSASVLSDSYPATSSGYGMYLALSSRPSLMFKHSSASSGHSSVALTRGRRSSVYSSPLIRSVGSETDGQKD